MESLEESSRFLKQILESNMNNAQDFHVSDVVFKQSQQEWASYLYALNWLMDELRTINQHSDLVPYFRRFYRIYRWIYPRIMIILLGVTDMDDDEASIALYKYDQSIRKDMRELAKIIHMMRSTRILTRLLADWHQIDSNRKIYQIADDIFADWQLSDDNTIIFNRGESGEQAVSDTPLESLR